VRVGESDGGREKCKNSAHEKNLFSHINIRIDAQYEGTLICDLNKLFT
jgi:hypothetical protein